MEEKERINLRDTGFSATMKLAGGNPGAIVVCVDILKYGGQIDPDGLTGGIGLLLLLDTFRIYEERIWMLHKDVCKCNLCDTVGMLRACQLGYLQAPILHHAIDNQGAGLDVREMVTKVKRRLPKFLTELPEGNMVRAKEPTRANRV